MTSPTAVLSPRGTPSSGPRCGVCATTIGPAHRHLLDVPQRALLCGCPACHDSPGDARFKPVPDRYLEFPADVLTQETWDDLRVPAGLAFVTRSDEGALLVCGPSPATTTQHELPPPVWNRLVRRHPAFATLRPDVEALLLRRAGCFLIPMDACYDLSATLRTSWRGFQDPAPPHARTRAARGVPDSLTMFMARLKARCHP